MWTADICRGLPKIITCRPFQCPLFEIFGGNRRSPLIHHKFSRSVQDRCQVLIPVLSGSHHCHRVCSENNAFFGKEMWPVRQFGEKVCNIWQHWKDPWLEEWRISSPVSPGATCSQKWVATCKRLIVVEETLFDVFQSCVNSHKFKK